jgi:hypothetical protein
LRLPIATRVYITNRLIFTLLTTTTFQIQFQLYVLEYRTIPVLPPFILGFITTPTNIPPTTMRPSPRLNLPILKRSSYYDSDYRQTAALIRARRPYVFKNAIMGLAIGGFAIGVCEYPFPSSISFPRKLPIFNTVFDNSSLRPEKLQFAITLGSPARK